jgi:hypothetical protein
MADKSPAGKINLPEEGEISGGLHVEQHGKPGPCDCGTLEVTVANDQIDDFIKLCGEESHQIKATWYRLSAYLLFLKAKECHGCVPCAKMEQFDLLLEKFGIIKEFEDLLALDMLKSLLEKDLATNATSP